MSTAKPFTPAIAEALGNRFDSALKARHELTRMINDHDNPFDRDEFQRLSDELNTATQAFYQQLWSATQPEIAARVATEYVPPVTVEIVEGETE